MGYESFRDIRTQVRTPCQTPPTYTSQQSAGELYDVNALEESVTGVSFSTKAMNVVTATGLEAGAKVGLNPPVSGVLGFELLGSACKNSAIYSRKFGGTMHSTFRKWVLTDQKLKARVLGALTMLNDAFFRRLFNISRRYVEYDVLCIKVFTHRGIASVLSSEWQVQCIQTVVGSWIRW